MEFAWRGLISLLADFVGLLGIPTLLVTTWRFYQELREERRERKAFKVVSEGCLEFYDSERRVGINLVPFEKVPVMPRPGDFILLPGEGSQYGAGEYEVERVGFTFWEAPEVDQPSPAALSKVTAYIRRRQR